MSTHNDTCPICLDEFNDTIPCSSTLIKLECNHGIHVKCLNEMICKNKKINFCPYCKKKSDIIITERNKLNTDIGILNTSNTTDANVSISMNNMISLITIEQAIDIERIRRSRLQRNRTNWFNGLLTYCFS